MIYCYESRGEVLSLSFPLGKAPKFVVRGKRRYRRSFQAEHVGIPSSAGWPLECEASGVHPSQAGELRDFLAKSGVPTEVSADGNPIYRDALHRKKALKARGLHDKDSFL